MVAAGSQPQSGGEGGSPWKGCERTWLYRVLQATRTWTGQG